MIKVKSNISLVSYSLLKKMQLLRDPKPLLRPVAFDVLVLMTERIHEKGLAANGSEIGTYNNAYLRFRQKVHKRNPDDKIVVSLTRQLENDWAVMATDRGWGIGFNNPHNAQKMIWVEEQKGKKIAALMKSEKDFAIDRLNKEVHKRLTA
jgi:hypothetical protein